MIKTILASITHNPHYLTKYINFITACQMQNESYTGYTERHHICPKAQDMFPEFTSFTEFPWNCVRLTPRQHFIAHWMLFKIYPDRASQAKALYIISNSRNIKVNSKLYDTLKLEAVEVSKRKVSVRDTNGKTSRVDKTDSRYLSGELTHINTGKVSVRDSKGNTLQVSVDDSRYLSGELVSVCKGKTTVIDINGNTFRIDITDPRFISGELVHVTKDKISEKRALTPDQVKEIRIAFKNPESIITEELLTSIVRSSQKDKISKISFEELRQPSGHRLSYRNLLANYYVDKFKVTRSIIINIIDGKTYKEITT